MLQISNSAASTLAGARDQKGLPRHFGIRIFARATETEQLDYQFGFVEEPQADDQVTETEGTRVFVAPEVASSLEGAVLDTEDSGRLVLVPQKT